MTKKRTTEEFINLLKKKFGDKYDFSDVVYNNSFEKVKVICPIHGEFYSRPNDLLNGHGCPACSNVKKLTTKEFIDKAKKIHGDLYDYSMVNYKNYSEPITIICHKKDENGIEHGPFVQSPRNHLQGNRCPKCYRNFKKTTKEFIEQAKKIHGDKYDYSKVDYNGNKKPVVIICPKHGEFEQAPLYHLQGNGCIHCYNERRGNSTKLGTENFIKNARKIHGDKYNYDKVNYINNKTKVIVTCPKHGDFLIKPNKHISSKQGCPKCSESHMEKEFASLLDTNNITYERQKTFEWLKIKAHLKLDFYLPQYSIAIECQGDQHFREYKYFSGRSSLENNIKRDEIKNRLCVEHGIKVLYLSHSNSIFEVSDIYTKENTFTSMKNLMQKIKNETLFNKIINETLCNLTKLDIN